MKYDGGTDDMLDCLQPLAPAVLPEDARLLAAVRSDLARMIVDRDRWRAEAERLEPTAPEWRLASFDARRGAKEGESCGS